jgi:hypothetical protein
VAVLKRYWGFLSLITALLCWTALVAGKVTASVAGAILVLSLAAVGYFGFQAPLLWCGAQIRNGGFCRNNCSGLLMGCHLRQHKWQKLRTVLRPRKWPVGHSIRPHGNRFHSAGPDRVLPLTRPFPSGRCPLRVCGSVRSKGRNTMASSIGGGLEGYL